MTGLVMKWRARHGDGGRSAAIVSLRQTANVTPTRFDGGDHPILLSPLPSPSFRLFGLFLHKPIPTKQGDLVHVVPLIRSPQAMTASARLLMA